MRACVLRDVGRLEVRDVPRPTCGEHEVLVAVEAVGLCGTDFHIVSGEANYALDERGEPIPLARAPQILGHEITGRVVEVGRRVTSAEVGERVVIDQGRNCRSQRRAPLCEYCASGDSHQCEHYQEHGITGLPGGLAELIAVPAVNTVRLEREELLPEHAALVEPLACVLHSLDLCRRAHSRYRLQGGDRPVRHLLVCGGGPAGLLFVQVLRRVLGYQGALLLSEPNPKKRALAQSFGAEAVDPTAADLTGFVADWSGGRRAECLVEATGSGPLFQQLPGLIRSQATVVLYGIGHAGIGMEALNQVQWREPCLLAPIGGSGGFTADGRPEVYERALRLVEEGTIDVAPLVSHRVAGLDGVAEVFAGAFRRADYVKGVVALAGEQADAGGG